MCAPSAYAELGYPLFPVLVPELGIYETTSDNFLGGKIPWFTPPPKKEGPVANGGDASTEVVEGREGRLGEIPGKRKSDVLTVTETDSAEAASDKDATSSGDEQGDVGDEDDEEEDASNFEKFDDEDDATNSSENDADDDGGTQL